ncbi:oligopeptide ABC transporter permease OppB [Treponema lecithinolyticum]|uniref:Oligopeptide transport system permease protein OppB n=1 Tax=Treponema lecithinolyticum ATCC 700332 TaxID=1321815 RepID=A0ABN0NYW0_TRELE|nr:oligopeptide ABC transporter permease OppB [Treponema lecithinolyticum]ERJ93212.1 oligopeptide transport system permease protein OppB [Treponema lecithinolyticum ATCC 700332]
MGRFIFRRILGLIPTMFLIITLSFFLIRLAPGGPFSSEKKVTPEVMQNLLKKYHMDEPLFKQYLRYMGDVLRGELGPSFKNKDYSVNELIAVSLPNSLILGVTSLALALLFGIAVGVVSALNQNSAADYTAMSAAVIGISVPLFVVGPVFMLVFAMKLQWLPTSGWITGRAGLKTLIMPAVTLAFPYFAYIARLSRASILEILRSDYIRTARAKGLKQSAVIWRHVLKGALLPVVSYLGPAFAGIVTGSVVVEQIFLVPGLGNFFVKSALNRDYTLIMGTVIVYSFILIVMNLIVDIIYGLLDPRISYK